jgi:hypothetical protein
VRRVFLTTIFLLAAGGSVLESRANPIAAVRWTAVVGQPHQPVAAYLYGPVDSVRYFAGGGWSLRHDKATAGVDLTCRRDDGSCPQPHTTAYPDTEKWDATTFMVGFLPPDSLWDTIGGHWYVNRWAVPYTFRDTAGHGRVIWAGPDSLSAVEAWGSEVLVSPDSTYPGLPYIVHTLGTTTVGGQRALRLEATRDTTLLQAWLP